MEAWHFAVFYGFFAVAGTAQKCALGTLLLDALTSCAGEQTPPPRGNVNPRFRGVLAYFALPLSRITANFDLRGTTLRGCKLLPPK